MDPASESEADDSDRLNLDTEADATDFSMMDALGASYSLDIDGVVRPNMEDDPTSPAPDGGEPEESGLAVPIDRDEMLLEQATDTWCQSLLGTKTSTKAFYRGADGIIRRRHPREADITQIVVPSRLRNRVCHMAHHHKLAGHPGHTQMLATLQLTYYWPEMASDIMDTVRTCPHCAKNRLRMLKHSKPMKLFPTLQPFEQGALDLLGPLPKTPRGNQHILAMSCRFSKLTQVVPLRTATVNTVASAFFPHWVTK